ncbi:MAG: glycosyltransferase [Candidatus Methanomethylicia archaeon]|nr:glycosyltransferase [Candidatus Methanomethylicia archaeon]
MIRVLTSNRAVSLKNVAKDIVKVCHKLKIDAVWDDRITSSYNLRKNRESCIIVMAVDPLFATPWFLLARDCYWGNVPCIFYGTTEGIINRRYVSRWMKEINFIANSNYVYDKINDAGLICREVVYHGIDFNEIEKARKMKSLGIEYFKNCGLDPSKDVIVLTICNSHPRKGLAWYDKVISNVKNKDQSIKFLVITEERGLSYFSNHSSLIVKTDFGKLPRETILSIIANAHIFALPSLAEGFGLPVLESMALGTPVIHGELPPLLEFSTGFVVKAKDITYFDKTEAGPSGIIFENYVYDTDEYADVILNIVDMLKNKKDEIENWKQKSIEKAKEFDIYNLYPKLISKIVGVV